MIGKQIKGTSFYGVLKYMENKVEKGVGLFLHSNMYGKSPSELNKEFEMIQSLRPTLKKAVYHVSLNLNPGENLTDDQFKDIAETYLNEMGFDANQFVAYRHYDRDHSHIHIISNRIKYDGSLVSDSNDYRRSEKIIRQIEGDYNLKQVKESKQSQKKAPSKGMIENSKKTGKAPLKLQLQEILDKAIQGKPSTKEFVQRLAKSGVDVRFYTNKNGVYGMSFTLDGIAFKASSLGKKYQWKNFINIIDYEYQRDLKTINEKSHRGKGKGAERTGGKSVFSEHGKHRGYERGAFAHSQLSEANDFIRGRRQYANIPGSESIEQEFRASWQRDRKPEDVAGQGEKNQNSHHVQNDFDRDSNRDNERRVDIPFSDDLFRFSRNMNDPKEEEKRKRKKRRKKSRGI